MAKFNSKRKIKLWLAGAKRRKLGNTRKRKAQIISTLSILLIIFVFGGAVTAFGAIFLLGRKLPSPTKLTEREVPQSTKIFARDGTLLYEIFGDQRRTLVALDDIPDELKNATIAVEDADFYKHQGFAILGWVRAIYNMARGYGLQGASTISQQLVKNTLLTPERTISRKIKEFILAIAIEKRYSKDEILQMYLNEAPYGGQAWGVGAASEMYFGKHVRDLSLAESALLAGLPQSPTRYSPWGSEPANAKERQSYVLYLMVRHGFLTSEQADEAKAKELHFLSPGQNIKAPHFVMFVKQKLVDIFGEKMVEQGGLRVWTTLDLGKQIIAEEEIKFQLDRLEKAHANASNAGLISLNPQTGEILAMVGSRDYFDTEHDGNVNVTLSSRQPGSAIKPIMYITAFESGYTAATFLSDIRTCWPSPEGEFCPTESDGKFWGPMLLRDALANSRNLPAVKMLQLVGIQNVIDQAHELGITTLNEPDRYGLSLTLGGGEVKPIDMAQVFSVFATGGIKNDTIAILKVEDANGKVLQEVKPEKIKGKRVLDEKYTYLLNNILSDNEARKRLFGAKNMLEIGRPAGVKTGTTNDNRDAWTIGYTPQLATAVWVGNFDNAQMAQNIQGSTGATPIWHYFMQRALSNEPVQTWEAPKDAFVQVEVDALSGKLPLEGKDFPRDSEIFIKGTEPTQIDDFHEVVEVCKDKGLLATDYHKEFGLTEEKVFLNLKELNPDWQKYTDEWMAGQEGYEKPPTEKCPITKDGEELKSPLVKIVAPAGGEKIADFAFDVEAHVYSAKTITKVEFYYDDTLVKSLTSIPYKTRLSLSPSEKGTHEIKVFAYDSNGEEGVDKVSVSLGEGAKSTVTPTPTVLPTPTQ